MNDLYKLAQDTYLDRLVSERDQLKVRLTKLQEFLTSNKTDDLDTQSLIDLGLQESLMVKLLEVLNRRVIRAEITESLK